MRVSHIIKHYLVCYSPIVVLCRRAVTCCWLSIQANYLSCISLSRSIFLPARQFSAHRACETISRSRMGDASLISPDLWLPTVHIWIRLSSVYGIWGNAVTRYSKKRTKKKKSSAYNCDLKVSLCRNCYSATNQPAVVVDSRNHIHLTTLDIIFDCLQTDSPLSAVRVGCHLCRSVCRPAIQLISIWCW